MTKGIKFLKKKEKQKEEPSRLKKKEEIVTEISKPQENKKLEKKRSKPKPDVYDMKKNTGMKVLRCVLWIMLTFIFLKGAWQIVKPDQVSEVNSIISRFKEEQRRTGDSPEEVQSFAQDFVREYLSYSNRGSADFKEESGLMLQKESWIKRKVFMGFETRLKLSMLMLTEKNYMLKTNGMYMFLQRLSMR